MQTVLIVIHLMIVSAMIGLVLLQKAEAGKPASLTSGPLWTRRIESRALEIEPHGAVCLHHRRRGFLAWQGSRFRSTWRGFAGARLQGPPAQARSLSQRRSGHDVALS